MKFSNRTLSLFALTIAAIHLGTSNSSAQVLQKCTINSYPFNLSNGKILATPHPVTGIITQAITANGARQALQLVGDSGPDAVGIAAAQQSISIIKFTRTLSGASGVTLKDIVVGDNPRAVVAGDFDNDGKQDIAVLRDTEIDILYNEGGDVFSAPVAVGKPSLGAGTITLGDFNMDGLLDIAANNSTVGVSTLKNLGSRNWEKNTNGTFRWNTFSFSALFLFINPQSLVSLKPDTTGKTAVALGNYYDGFLVDKSVDVLHNITTTIGGAIKFKLGTSDQFDLGTSTSSMAVGDFNKDGRDDLLALNTEANQISILTGSGGSLTPSASYLTGAAAQSLAVATADLNGDNFSDALTANGAGLSISALVSSGGSTNSLKAAMLRTTTKAPESIGAIDVDLDGDADVITGTADSSGGVILFTNLRLIKVCVF